MFYSSGDYRIGHRGASRSLQGFRRLQVGDGEPYVSDLKLLMMLMPRID